MPPLGPISTNVNKSLVLEAIKTTQVSPTGAADSVVFAPSSLVSGKGANNQVGKDAQVSPTHTGAINVGDVAISSPGSKLIRIQDGQIVQEVQPSRTVSPPQGKTENRTVVTLNQTVLGANGKANGKVTQAAKQAVSGTPTVSLQRIPVPSFAGRSQTLISSSNPSLQSTVSISQLAKQPVGASQLVRKGSTGVTLVQQSPSVRAPQQPQQQQPGVVPVMSNPPAGTQYYITAKSTDKNLQGKVILIPQQVFAGQSGKGGRGSNPGQASKQG